MSALTRFFKKNKVVEENRKYAPTASLQDEKGNPLEFEFRKLTTRQDDAIRDSCTTEVQVTGKPNMFRPKIDTSLYMAKMIATSCVFPDLYNAELQDSYGVKTPEDLIKELVDNPGEYQELGKFVQELNGFTSLQDKAAEAKN